jgi:branched-chain amino acid transport system substrate-binding protein
VRKYGLLSLLVLAVSALALVAAGCGGDGDGGGAGGEVTALPASACGPIQQGSEEPDYLIASDLPLQGGSRQQTTQMNDAITYVLELADWKAGDKNIAFQECDDATAQLAKWDPGKCSANANAYAANESLIAVIGTFNSGCAAIEIPILNRAPGGGLLMLSPANTYGCLTEPCAGNEPEKYYPTGTRHYARVAPSDPNQAAVQVKLMQDKGVESLYILNDKEAYGLGVAKNVQGAAKAAGIDVLGFDAFDPKSSNFRATFTKIKGTNPDAIFIGGLVDENSGQLIDDKVSVLGPNTPTPDGVMLFLPDGYTANAVFQRSEGGTPNAKGAFFTVAGVGIDQYKGAALEFIDGFKTEKLGGKEVDPYAILGAQAAQVVLDAIERSDGSRASVIEEVFKTEIEDGLIGDFSFNENGDLSGATGAAVLFTIYEGTTELKTVETTSPDPDLTEAARQEAAG